MSDQQVIDHLRALEEKVDEYAKTEVSTIVAQAHIIDADGGLADITTKFNALLAALEAVGVLATS